MILKEIKTYMQEHKQATLEELSRVLAFTPSLIEMALEEWVKKGKVVKEQPPKVCSCSGCTNVSCTPPPVFYKWSKN